MPKLGLTALAAIAILIAGCGSRASEQSLAAAGCKIDAAQACASIKGHAVDMSNTGMSGDQRMVEQNSAATANIHIPIQFPSGDPDLTINCNIKTRTQAVVYAEVVPGPALSDKDIDFLRGAGFCSQ
jgi:hypothetical protein